MNCRDPELEVKRMGGIRIEQYSESVNVQQFASNSDDSTGRHIHVQNNFSITNSAGDRRSPTHFEFMPLDNRLTGILQEHHESACIH